MSDSRSTASSGGIGFFGLLTIVFIVMKLMGWGAVAQWSWFWVLAPLWIGFAVVVFLLVLFLIVGALIEILARR